MSIQASLQKTPAEEALGVALPTRRVESFHYTDLRTLLKDVPSAANSAAASSDYKPLVPTHLLSFVDGKLTGDQVLPAGVTMSTDISKAKSIDINDVVVSINGAIDGDAISIKIDGDSTLEKPLGLGHVSSDNARSACYHKVHVTADSKANIIDRYTSAGNSSYLSSAVADIVVEKGATVNWFIIQQENTQATRLARMNVDIAEDAEINIFILNAGGKLVRQEVKIAVNGENSNVGIKGVNLVGDGAHIDVTTVLEHNVPHTNAEELFRNVVTGDGHGVFQGQIKVAQPAQKTDAQMACNTLLLTDESNFSAKPELEIFADDVICAHGATITDIDDEHMFYLKARGIPEKTARQLLIKAFVDEVVEELEAGEELEETFINIIDTWLDDNI